MKVKRKAANDWSKNKNRVMAHSFHEAPALAERQVRGSAFSLGSASLTEGKAPLRNILAKPHGRRSPDFACGDQRFRAGPGPRSPRGRFILLRDFFFF